RGEHVSPAVTGRSPELWLLHVNGSAARPLAGTGGGRYQVNQPQWSAGGQWILFSRTTVLPHPGPQTCSWRGSLLPPAAASGSPVPARGTSRCSAGTGPEPPGTAAGAPGLAGTWRPLSSRHSERHKRP